jgi:hypothetical protein
MIAGMLACMFLGFPSGCFRSESRLQEYFLHVANKNAAAEAVKTEKFSGAFRPRAKVIERANKSRSQPLKKAATRVNPPRTSAMPSRVSAQVAAQARAVIAADGMNQLSFPVYATKCEKSPQATLGCPKLPQRPNRSATAARKEMPRASRKNIEL